MNPGDKKEFSEILTKVFAAYGQALPVGPLLTAWWDELNPFPANVVGMAFSVYRDEQPKFAPNPNAIRKICREHDGRPDAGEAWAIALSCKDESDTVVWTREIAEAYSICTPIMDLGDEVGARMAFKDAYQRLVTAARVSGAPAQWSASLGWDMQKRATVLTKASNAGLLAAPAVAALLPPPDVSPATCDSNARAQIDKIRKMKADMDAKKALEYELSLQREREATAQAKRDAQEKVRNYVAADDKNVRRIS